MKQKIVKISVKILLFALLLVQLTPAIDVHAAGASLYFSPASGKANIGDNFTLAVKTFTDGKSINASEAVVNFDKNLLEVVSLSKSGSIFNMWTTEPNFSNANGSVSFGGGIARPGFSGQTGKILNIIFRAKAAGTAQIRFSSGAVLANDGQGSNILETMGNASYVITAKEVVGQPESVKGVETSAAKPQDVAIVKETNSINDYNKPTVTSATHPNQNAWTNKSDVQLDWQLPAGTVAVSYDFNKELNYEPKEEPQGLISSKAYQSVADGVWYFHLRFQDGKKWGTTEHYRVMIDTIRPQPFDARVEQRDASTWPVLYFKSKDALSGVRSYEIFVNSLEETKYDISEDESQEILSAELSKLGYGDHTALIKVEDKAGNQTDTTIKFRIEPIEMPKIKNYSKEIRSSEQFFVSGTSLSDVAVNVYIQDETGHTVVKQVRSDANGNWFYLNDKGLKNGRYIAWIEAENTNGLKSMPTSKIGFIVSPPIFTTIGSFVINYVTVIVGLIFMVVFVIVSILYMVGLIRKRLKKETVEVETVLSQNMASLKNAVDEEVIRINQLKRAAEMKKQSQALQASLKNSIDVTEKKILSEIKDVEDILK
ncbi:hypothetical protein HGA64_01370 [Candidatus Falkowbacteria bacterium]|nr:hypothetical protein [Candidatus Falkowbacteria bacterium]